jgi:hypothetical protein
MQAGGVSLALFREEPTLSPYHSCGLSKVPSFAASDVVAISTRVEQISCVTTPASELLGIAQRSAYPRKPIPRAINAAQRISTTTAASSQ